MTGEYKWYASRDDEDYEIGPCSSREEVIQEAMDADLGLRQGPDGNWDRLTFYILEAQLVPLDLSKYVGDDTIVQAICEHVDDNHYDEANDRSPVEDAWTMDQERDLQARVRQAVADWQAHHAIVVEPSRFTHTRNHETIDLQVALPVS